MTLSSVIPANDTRESVFGLRNFPHPKLGSNLGPLAPEASALTTELQCLQDWDSGSSLHVDRDRDAFNLFLNVNMDPPSRVQSLYHSGMVPITWLCTLSEEKEQTCPDQ